MLNLFLPKKIDAVSLARVPMSTTDIESQEIYDDFDIKLAGKRLREHLDEKVIEPNQVISVLIQELGFVKIVKVGTGNGSRGSLTENVINQVRNEFGSKLDYLVIHTLVLRGKEYELLADT